MNIKLCVLSVLLIPAILSYKESEAQIDSAFRKQKMNDCFITKPVSKNAEETFPNFSLKDTMMQIKTSAFDNSCKFVTSFDIQKRMIINYDCFKLLNKPDGIFLMDLVNNYDDIAPRRENVRAKGINFKRSFKSNIPGFGKAAIFEYNIAHSDTLVGDPSFLTLIFHDQGDNVSHYDSHGIAILSFGALFQSIEKSEKMTLRYLQGFGKSMDRLLVNVQLKYDTGTERFVPVSHQVLLRKYKQTGN